MVEYDAKLLFQIGRGCVPNADEDEEVFREVEEYIQEINWNEELGEGIEVIQHSRAIRDGDPDSGIHNWRVQLRIRSDFDRIATADAVRGDDGWNESEVSFGREAWYEVKPSSAYANLFHADDVEVAEEYWASLASVAQHMKLRDYEALPAETRAELDLMEESYLHLWRGADWLTHHWGHYGEQFHDGTMLELCDTVEVRLKRSYFRRPPEGLPEGWFVHVREACSWGPDGEFLKYGKPYHARWHMYGLVEIV